MNTPLVSVIIPTYNRANMIHRAIDSVLIQTYENFEIIVADDASTDNTREIIENYNNSKIRYLRLDVNRGQCYARNRAIEIAKGEYIGFLDSDDEWMPEKLEKQIACFENGEKSLGAVYGYSYEVDETTNTSWLQDSGFKRGELFNDFIRGYCPATPSLFLVKKNILLEVGMFDENLLTFVDLDLWLRISQKYTFDFVEKPMIKKYEHSGDQYVSNFNKRAKGLDLLLNKWGNIIEKNLGKEYLTSFRKERTIKTIGLVLKRPNDNYRNYFLNIIKELMRINSLNIWLYFKALVVYLAGPSAIRYYYKKLKR